MTQHFSAKGIATTLLPPLPSYHHYPHITTTLLPPLPSYHHYPPTTTTLIPPLPSYYHHPPTTTTLIPSPPSYHRHPHAITTFISPPPSYLYSCLSLHSPIVSSILFELHLNKLAKPATVVIGNSHGIAKGLHIKRKADCNRLITEESMWVVDRS